MLNVTCFYDVVLVFLAEVKYDFYSLSFPKFTDT